MLSISHYKQLALNKRYLPLLSLAAVLPVLFTVNLYETLSFSDSANTNDSGFIYGHLTLEVKDQFGNIKFYSQGDNVVVNNGENCAAKLLFQETTGAAGTTVCTGANTVGFRYIGLDEGAGPYAEDNFGLENPADSAGLSTPLRGSVVWTNSTGTGGSSGVTIVIAATFTNSGASETITGAGLFNSTATNMGMFSHKLAASSATVDLLDTLTTTWTITVAGA